MINTLYNSAYRRFTTVCLCHHEQALGRVGAMLCPKKTHFKGEVEEFGARGQHVISFFPQSNLKVIGIFIVY